MSYSELRWTGEFDAFPAARLAETEVGCVEHEAWGGGAVAVEDVAQDGVSQAAGFPRRRGVYSQLMAAAGDGLKLDASPVGLASHHAEVSLSRAALLVIDDLIWAIGEISAHGERDVALVGLDQAADKGDIAFLSFAKFELHAQVALRIWIQAQDQEARSVHVETVDHKRPCGGRKHGSNSRYCTIGFIFTFAGDAEHAAGLVDNDELVVGKDDGYGVHVQGLLQGIGERAGIQRIF